jgi:hypothetical protein
VITIPNLYFFFVLAVFVTVLIGTATYYHLRYRRTQSISYGHLETLLKRLCSIDRGSVALIARDLVDESGRRRTDQDDLDLDPSQIWPLIGGIEGLEALERNCAVLVDLVFYVQHWYPEVVTLAEELRLNAREIEWHVSRLKGAAKKGKLESSFPDSAQRAVATYYLMTRRVLILYEQMNMPGLAKLQRAL